MRRRLLTMSAAILCIAAAPVLAQNPNAKGQEQATNRAALQKIYNEIAPKAKVNKEQALQLARQKNWVVRQVQENGTVVSLEGVDERGFPIHYITDNNTRAAASVKTDQVWPGGSTGFNLSGGSDALRGKLGVWDGGAVRLSHQELVGRVTQRDGSTAISDHAVHVSGTMVASGVNPLAKGMSFGAKDLQAWDFSNDAPEMAAAAHELLISNHSYGTIAGWYYNTGRAGTAANPYWELRANPNISATEDYNFGYYNSAAQQWDQIAFNAPYYLMVKSAGNNRNQTGPAVGQPYWRLSNTGTWVLEAQRQAGISSNNGYDIISTYGNAKNILTVGAVEPIANGYKTPSDVKISSFSSWGPTDDGRIKPDIVGNGVALLSSIGTADDAYSSMNGTSMSAPNVSGSLNLLQEHYYNTFGNFMRAATLKGLAIHTADEAGTTPGPDYVYGWGLLNTEKAARMISNAGSNLINERVLAQGETYTFNVTASGAGPLVVTIAWTDVEGQVIPIGPSALNNRTPRLVNDLDVRVSKGLTTFLPWVLDPANPSLPAGFGDNFRDNVEQVYIANAVPGENYTITIRHKGTLAQGPQAYSLLVSGIGGSAYCASNALSDADSKITHFSLGGLNNTPAAGCSASGDYTNLTANLEIGQTAPLSLTLGTCGTDITKMAKVYIDWNSDGDFDDAGELVATTGAVSSTETYTTSVTVPTHVKEGNISRMRVVLVETANADDVSACGSYGKGETHDYRVRFLASSKDVGIAAIMFPTQGFCANPNQSVQVTIQNFGTAAQSNIPVTVKISNSNGQITTLDGTFAGSLASNSTTGFFLPGTFNAEAGATYTFTASTALANDQNSGNNQLVQTLSSSNLTDAPVASATVCGTGPTVLRASGNGTVFWYDALTGGNLVAAGNEATVANTTANKTYYAAMNEFSGTIPSASYTTGGAMSSFANGRMYFDAEVPFILEKATINVGTGGTMTVDLLDKDLSSNVIASTVITVSPGVNEYMLNLPVPSAGKNYTLLVSAFGGGATAYRNNTTNSAAYPLTIPHVVTLTGNNGGTPSAFYYFLYNLKVKALGCASPRVAVTSTAAPATVAKITPAGPTAFCVGGSVALNANTGSGLSYTWFKDGEEIVNATAASYTATVSGDYTVTVTAANGCPQSSEVVAVTVNPLPPTELSITKNFSLGTCPGDAFALELSAETSEQHEAFAYQWTKDGTPIANATAATYSATTSGNYTVTVTTPCGAITATPVTVNNGAAQVTAPGVEICGTSGKATLAAQTNMGKLFWFDAATGGSLLHIGESFTTPTLTQSTNYYVAASNETIGNLGSKNHSVNGAYSSFSGGRMYFDAEVPFVLEKATINVATAGTMTVVIVDKDMSNTIIASTTINVTPGIKEYDLNLLVPAAGKNYGIQVSAFGGGATAYRTAATNAAPYPYTLPSIASITGNNQTAPSSFYYFLYDWQVSTASCSAAPRVSIPVNVTPVTVAGTLSASAASVCTGSNSGTISLSGQTGIAVLWEASIDGTNWTTVSGTASQLQFTDLTQTTSYRALVQSGGCSEVYTAAATVVVNELPAAAISVSEANKLGFVTLSAAPTGKGYKYLWSNGETKASISVRPGDHIYTVTVTDANGCSATSAETMALPMKKSATSTLKGIQEAQDGISLKVYPNPNTGRFTVSFTADDAAKVSVRLVSAVGQVILEETKDNFSGNYERQVSMEGAPKGVYILQVSLSDRTITRKVIIQH